MQSTRQNKICRLIQQDMSDIFLREMKPVLGPSLISVTEVRITPDLSIARIYVSIMPIGGCSPDSIMALIRDNSADLRRRLGLREGKQLRIIPQLEFFIDDTLDYVENIDRLLKEDGINRENAPEQESQDEDAENIEKIESSVNDNELDEEDDKIFKLFLSTLDYEITDVNVEKDSATVTAKISNKDSGEIFRNYFTRAIKLAINQALSSNKGDEGKLESELQKYLEEQVVSSEIPTVTNEVVFNLEKGSDSWIIKNYDKDLTDVIFPNLINTIAELGEQYGEYGD